MNAKLINVVPSLMWGCALAFWALAVLQVPVDLGGKVYAQGADASCFTGRASWGTRYCYQNNCPTCPLTRFTPATCGGA